MTPQIAIALIAVFASIALAVMLIGTLALRWLTPEQREIRKLAGRGAEGIIGELELSDISSPWVKRFQQVVPKSPKEMSKLRRRLTTAGYRSATAAVLYGAAEVISRRVIFYIAFGIIFGVIYQGPRQFLNYLGPGSLAVQLGISFLWGYAFIHYYLDSKIWRVRRDPSVGKALNM